MKILKTVLPDSPYGINFVSHKKLEEEMDKKGLYNKYSVKRNDRSKKHKNCEYFVLDLTHDIHSIPALKAYVESLRSAFDGSYYYLIQDLELKISVLED